MHAGFQDRQPGRCGQRQPAGHCVGEVATEKSGSFGEAGDGGGRGTASCSRARELWRLDSWWALPSSRSGLRAAGWAEECRCPTAQGGAHDLWGAVPQTMAPQVPAPSPAPPSLPHLWGFSHFLSLLLSSEGPDGLRCLRDLERRGHFCPWAADPARPSLPPASIPGRPAEWPRGWRPQGRRGDPAAGRRAGLLRGPGASGSWPSGGRLPPAYAGSSPVLAPPWGQKGILRPSQCLLSLASSALQASAGPWAPGPLGCPPAWGLSDWGGRSSSAPPPAAGRWGPLGLGVPRAASASWMVLGVRPRGLWAESCLSPPAPLDQTADS